MTTKTKTTLIFLLVVPLLLGAVATKQREVKNEAKPNTDAPRATAEAQSQPATAVQPVVPVSDAENIGVPAIEPASVASTYSIDWYSINGGGTTNASSTNYQMGASVGQSVAGAASSPSYQLGIGFWYGAGGGGCTCDCHGDPGGPCDGFTNILDVTQVVNAAFRNYPPMLDPNANCPYQTTDVNCSGSPEVLDVVKMVNVAFRNGNPATEFCNPCP